MRFVTDDGNFGFIVTQHGGRHMFRFQLVMEGQVIGDAEPSILGSAMHQFSSLAQMNDARLSPTVIEPSDILSVLLTDEDIYDRVLLSSAESLDQWDIRGYRINGNAVLLAQQYHDGELSGRIYSAVLQECQYQELIDMVRHYWNTVNNKMYTNL